MSILNLTQHASTPEQQCSEPSKKSEVSVLLTFDTLPNADEVEERAQALAALAAEVRPRPRFAMIGGAPYLMGPLERALKKQDIVPVYAFSVRESVEKSDSKGGVVKTAIFRHVGFVAAAGCITPE